MTSTMMPTTTTWSRATSSCVGGHCAATPTDGGWGWGCCNTGASPHGCGCGARPRRSISARPPDAGVARGVDAELVELLTSMALTVAARG